jgi:Trypsin-like peptidase domain
MPKAAAKHLPHYTAHIVAGRNSGPNPGTAFLLDLQLCEDRVEPVLVTCRHIVESCSQCSIYVSILENGKRSGMPREIPLPSGVSEWAAHPDPAIDLAALPIRTHLEFAEKGIGLPLCRPAISQEMIADAAYLEEMDFAEEVLVIGYPNALWDAANNLPLFSKGLAATHPGMDFNGRPEFIIDAASFPGSSGSPVFSYRSVKERANDPKLLGVLYAGEMFPIEGKIVIRRKPEAEEDDVRLQIPMNFTRVIRASKLLDFRTALFP